MVALAGLDPIKYLEIKDPLVRGLTDMIVDEVLEAQERRDENLATKIINKLSSAIK